MTVEAQRIFLPRKTQTAQTFKVAVAWMKRSVIRGCLVNGTAYGIVYHRDTGFSMLFRCEKTWYKYRTASNEYPVANDMIYLEPMTVFNMTQQPRVFPRPSSLAPRP
jgi:hypothetical protein